MNTTNLGLLPREERALEDARRQVRRGPRDAVLKLPNPWGLTPMQCAVLQLYIEGKCTKQIGAALDISSKTVDVHRGRLLEAMGCNTTRAAVLFDRFLRGQAT